MPSGMRHLILASLILAGGAEGGGPSDETSVPTNPSTPQTGPLLTGEEIQGVYLLGNLADGFSTGRSKYISVVAPATMTIGVNGQSLAIRDASGATPGLPWNLPVAAPNTGTLRVDSIGATGYHITYVD